MKTQDQVETRLIALRSELDRLREEIGVTPTMMDLEDLLLRLCEEIKREQN